MTWKAASKRFCKKELLDKSVVRGIGHHVKDPYKQRTYIYNTPRGNIIKK